MIMNKYNGWSNRETWLVNLHFEITDLAELEYAKEYIDEMVEKLAKESPLLSDMLDTECINWKELEEHIE